VPPQAMSTCEAARWHTAMPQGAVEALPGGERSGTFVRPVPVVEEEGGHVSILARRRPSFIGGQP
jgi:hypothetical protein